jgi:DNA-binding SARP family transcriptional activator
MSPSVLVDLRAVQRRAQTALEVPALISPPDCEALVASLSRELLPEWTEDWLVLERERWDQVRLYALEGVAEQLRARGQYLGAMKTALAAIAVEPFRETSHCIVIEVHLAEGNTASALMHYQRYRSLLHRELGVAPSPRMAQLASTFLSP